MRILCCPAASTETVRDVTPSQYGSINSNDNQGSIAHTDVVGPATVVPDVRTTPSITGTTEMAGERQLPAAWLYSLSATSSPCKVQRRAAKTYHRADFSAPLSWHAPMKAVPPLLLSMLLLLMQLTCCRAALERHAQPCAAGSSSADSACVFACSDAGRDPERPQHA